MMKPTKEWTKEEKERFWNLDPESQWEILNAIKNGEDIDFTDPYEEWEETQND